MSSETKICQNCKENFAIEPEDFQFYERIKVPPPTWCPECRMVRQLNFRNESSLYRRKCDAPNHGEELISIFSSHNKVPVYDYKYWWSDKWDPLSFGRSYDFSKPFFEQLREVLARVPEPNIINKNSINSEYCNTVLDLKNCYYLFAASKSEDTYYSRWADSVRNCMDNLWVVTSELCYGSILCEESYNLRFSGFCMQCSDSAFLWDCRNCSNCFGCVALRNKSYYIFNEPYSKEDYQVKVKEYDLGSFKNFIHFAGKFHEFRLNYPHRYARIVNSPNSTGDNIRNSKNAFYCFDVRGDGIEDCRYVTVTFGQPIKDSHSTFIIVDSGSLIYDSASIINGYSVLFSKKIWTGQNVQYSYNCHNCNNIFGCVGLRNKQYCILNKKYAKEEYEKLVPRIIDHMNTMPYVDSKGRTYKYGEFFPPDLSPFAYNETIAQEYFPLTKDQALAQGYRWEDPEERNYKITQLPNNLPDHIKDVQDDILNQVIGCAHNQECNEQCTQAFKIIPEELQFYRRMNLPLPRLCPNCRHYQRLKQRNPLKLWHRQCMCDYKVYENTAKHSHHPQGRCPNEFEASYSPDRKEIVYCEQCYNAEVV